MPTDDPIRVIEELFTSEGAADYLGEAVTQAAHMLLAAALAEQAGAAPALVAAASLHDVGHFEPGYFERLSPASVYTLGVQGGPMADDELAAFEANPFGKDACQVRRWDDDAKNPDAPTPPFGHFVPVLAALLS